MAGIYNGPARGGTRGGKDQVPRGPQLLPRAPLVTRARACHNRVRAAAVQLGGRQGR